MNIIPKRKSRLILLLVLLVCVASGSWIYYRTEIQGEGLRVEWLSWKRELTPIGSINYTLHTDKSTYEHDEPIMITYSVTNNTPRTRQFSFLVETQVVVNISDPSRNTVVYLDNSGVDYFEPTNFSLEPDETKTYTWTWTMTEPELNSLTGSFPTGTYTLKAALNGYRKSARTTKIEVMKKE